MFKRFLFLPIVLIKLILLFSQTSNAAPAYGTHMPQERHWRWGVEGNFLLDRDLDNDEGEANGDRYFLTGSYGIFSWFSFDGKIGVGDVDWDRTTGNNDLSYDTNFAGAYGFRIKGFENKDWGIRGIAGFQHISVHPEPKNQDGNKNEVIIDEWQGSVIISKEIQNLVPYIGGRYGTLDLIKWTNEMNRKRIKSEKDFGIIIGFDCWLNKRTKVNLEGIFLDGEEVAAGISYDF